MILVPVSFGGRVWADFNCSAGFPVGLQGGGAVSPIMLERQGQPPLYAGSRIGPRVIPIEFTVLPTSSSTETGDYRDVGYTLMRILGAIKTGDDEQRTLVVRIADGPWAGDELECQASVGQYRYPVGNRNSVTVDFHLADDVWRRRTDTQVPAARFSATSAMPLSNRGLATTYPTLKLQQITQRASESPTVGWKFRRTIEIENNSSRNWWQLPWCIDLGDTAAWVTAGEALTSGDDVVPRVDGRQLYRTLTNFNTKRSFMWVVLDIPAGESVEVEILHGNPDASSDNTPNLHTRSGYDDTYIAYDTQGLSGTATGGSSSTLNTGIAMELSRWSRGYIQITEGQGAGQIRRIEDNDAAGVITVNRNWSTAPNNTSKYVIWTSGYFGDGGRVTARTASSITDNAHTEKWGTNQLKGATVTFLSPSGATPATMEVASNTTDTISFAGSFSVQPAVSDSYVIHRYGTHNYHTAESVIDTFHRGLWRINRYFSKGARAVYGDQTPGGWSPWLMLANNDDKAQGRFVDEGASLSHAIENWPYLYARRSVRSANTWPEKGIADGVALYDPRGLQGFYLTYRLKNESGIGQFEIRTQEPGGDDWQTIASDNTTYASLTNVNSGGAAGYSNLFTDTDAPIRLWMGVLPANGDEIPSTQKKDRTIEVRNHARCVVHLAIEDIGGLSGGVLSPGAKASIWDCNVVLRLGGGSDRVPPFQEIQLGGQGRYLQLTSSQKLWINGKPDETRPLFGIYSGDTLVREVANAGTFYRYVEDVDGNAVAIEANELLPLEPVVNIFDDYATASVWTVTPGAGVTASVSQSTSEDYDNDGKTLRVQFTALPAGPWTITLEKTTPITVIPGELYEWGFAIKRQGLTTAAYATMTMAWGDGVNTNDEDPDQTAGVSVWVNDLWYTNGGGRKIYPGPPQWATIYTYGATVEAWPSITITGDGTTTGSIYLEMYLGPNGRNLYISEAEMGEIAVEAVWREGMTA